MNTINGLKGPIRGADSISGMIPAIIVLLLFLLFIGLQVYFILATFLER